MERVGFERPPNVSAMPQLSTERLRSTMERHRVDTASASDVHLDDDFLARRVVTLLPACNHGIIARFDLFLIYLRIMQMTLNISKTF